MTTSVTLEDWIAEYGDMVFSLCLKVVRDRELALDTCQSVWEIVLENKDAFRNESGPGTWIYSIAYREALRAAKKEKARRYKDTLRRYHDATLNPETEGGRIDDAAAYAWLSGTCDTCLSGIVGTLAFNTRIIVVFRYVLGVPYGDIAEILGMEQSAVRKAASRGMRRLAVFFENECGLYRKNSRCRCGLEQHLGTTSFRNDILAIKSITERARRILSSGKSLPPIGYWEKVSETCHK
jgi:RNA polymerase sigma-70 factor (ECF subfamily)